MAILAPSFVHFLPADLAVWVEARATVEGVTPDALVLVMLRGYQRMVDYHDRERPEARLGGPPPVSVERAIATLADQAVAVAATHLPAETPAPHVRRKYCPTSKETAALVVTAVAQLGQARIGDVIAFAALRGVTLHYGAAGCLLTWLAKQGQLRRVRYGVYEKAADVAAVESWED